MLPHLPPLSRVSVPCLGSWDVVIIGGGAAGLYTALSLPRSLRVLVVSKETLPQSASSWAQGGIATVYGADDSPELHAADTLRSGVGLCEPAAVNVLVKEARDRLEELLTWGVPFDRNSLPPFLLATTLEAAHSRNRVLHVADATGKALIDCLIDQTQAAAHIDIWEGWPALDLCWVDDRCVGVVGPDGWIGAAHTVLASGGAGQVYSNTTNPVASTGDGMAIAWRSGVSLRDLEFVQFHPTALSLPNAPRALISEAVRGEGAHLVTASGDRFMFAADPAGELAPRDVVSRAIFNQNEAVFLDMRPIPVAQLEHRFPNILQLCRSHDLDPLTQPIPVAPAAHYSMGGIQTDLMGQTSRACLYAVGEVASTGVHGANRLASNSLLECLVFAHRVSRAIASSTCGLNTATPITPTFTAPIEPPSLAPVMWQTAGIIRDRIGLTQALQQCQQQAWGPVGSATQRNLWQLSQLMVASMLFRQESRGGHFRSDYPTTQPQWAAHTHIQANQMTLVPLTAPIPA